MKQVPYRQSMLAIALCALVGTAAAQSTTAPSPMAPGAHSPTTTAPATTTAPPTGASTMRMPSRTEPADSAYRSLDTANRGYLSKSDVHGLAGFSFDDADANKDGKLSKEEFARAWGSKPQ